MPDRGTGRGGEIKFGADIEDAAEQNREFRIGLSALLEGQAFLDCFLKPLENEIAQVGIDVVESMFRSRNLKINRPHIIGTESCLAAVGLGNQKFREPSLRENLAIAANLPGLVVTHYIQLFTYITIKIYQKVCRLPAKIAGGLESKFLEF